MALTFNADEVFTIAETFERNGARFYRRAAELAPVQRDFLLSLAAMEDGHLDTFSKMHAELSASERESATFDPDNESSLYLAEMVRGRIFKAGDAAAALLSDVSLAHILQTAIGLEKESVVFYSGLREGLLDAGVKTRLDAVIREEFSHIALLSAHLARL